MDKKQLAASLVNLAQELLVAAGNPAKGKHNDFLYQLRKRLAAGVPLKVEDYGQGELFIELTDPKYDALEDMKVGLQYVETGNTMFPDRAGGWWVYDPNEGGPSTLRGAAKPKQQLQALLKSALAGAKTPFDQAKALGQAARAIVPLLTQINDAYLHSMK